ncbi:M23 family metallopeptidase [Allocatelliglobosispora scoriae]|nr:M23 family metallopeptidase [Allocatelliglobosispora scoriae]
MTDAKDANSNALTGMEYSSTEGGQDADRTAAAEKASRAMDRSGGMSTSMTEAPDAWILPLQDYQFTSPFGRRWGKLHAGVDLAVPEGTPYYAVHGGKVILAKWFGGYGYCVIIDHGNGLQTVYGHSSKLIVKEGQEVKTGQLLALAGNTGHSFGSHVHLEIHVNGTPVDPIPWFKQHGVDIKLHVVGAY